jgi:hypothetical protein
VNFISFSKVLCWEVPSGGPTVINFFDFAMRKWLERLGSRMVFVGGRFVPALTLEHPLDVLYCTCRLYEPSLD